MKIIQTIKILISLFLMFYLLRKIGVVELKAVLAKLKPASLCTASLLFTASIIINALKWHVCLPKSKLSFLTFLSFRAQFYATVLPGQMFGEVSKLSVWRGKEYEGFYIAASVLFDKLTGFMAQFLIAALTLSFFLPGFEKKNITFFCIASTVLLFGVIFLSSKTYMASIINKALNFTESKVPAVGKRLKSFYSAWCLFSKNKWILIKSLAYGLINTGIGILTSFILSKSLGLDVPLVAWGWIMNLLSVILILPVSFAGIGLRDASLSSILSLYGVSTADSLAISSALLLCQGVCALMGGIMTAVYSAQKNQTQ